MKKQVNMTWPKESNKAVTTDKELEIYELLDKEFRYIFLKSLMIYKEKKQRKKEGTKKIKEGKRHRQINEIQKTNKMIDKTIESS